MIDLADVPSIQEVLAATKEVLAAQEEAARLRRQEYNRREDVRAMKRAYHQRMRLKRCASQERKESVIAQDHTGLPVSVASASVVGGVSDE
jgi:hypothetical protein